MRLCVLMVVVVFVGTAHAQLPKSGAAGEQEKTKLKRPDDDGKKKTDATAPTDSEEAKIIERLTKNSRTAEQRLSQHDPGEQTRKLQRDLLKDIDDLLELLKKPPPPSDSSQSSSSSSSSSSSASKSGGSPKSGATSRGGATASATGKQGGLTRREQRERRRQQEPQANDHGASSGNNPMNAQNANAKPNPQKDPMTAGNATPTSSGKTAASGRPDKGRNDSTAIDPLVADLYKDVWGHLPEKARQEMDSYFKERFMPRYSDLLRQYYSTIAEQGKK